MNDQPGCHIRMEVHPDGFGAKCEVDEQRDEDHPDERRYTETPVQGLRLDQSADHKGTPEIEVVASSELAAGDACSNVSVRPGVMLRTERHKLALAPLFKMLFL